MSSELYNLLTDMQNEKNEKLKPENIRQGIKVFGVTGTMVAPADNRIIRYYKDMPSMLEEADPREGDISIVYDYQYYDLAEDNKWLPFSSVKMKSSFSVDTPITASATNKFISNAYKEYNYGTSVIVTSSPTYVNVDINSSYENDYNNRLSVRVTYTTEDSQRFTLSSYEAILSAACGTYVSTDPNEPVYLFHPVHWSEGDYNINGPAKVLEISAKNFDGVYQYSKYVDKNTMQSLKTFSLDVDTNKILGEQGVLFDSKQLAYDLAYPIFNKPEYFKLPKTDYEEERFEFIGLWLENKKTEESSNSTYTGYGVKSINGNYWNSVDLYKSNDTVYLSTNFSKSELSANEAFIPKYIKITIDRNTGNMTVEEIEITSEPFYEDNYTVYYTLEILPETEGVVPVSFRCPTIHDYQSIEIRSGMSRLLELNIGETSTTLNSGHWQVNLGVATNWNIANNQLSLHSSSQLAENVTGYGVNGIVSGDGSIKNTIKIKDLCNMVLPKLQTPRFSSASSMHSGDHPYVKPFTPVEYERCTFAEANISEGPETTISERKKDVITINDTDYTAYQKYLSDSYYTKNNYNMLINNNKYKLTYGCSYSNGGSGTSTRYGTVTKITVYITNLKDGSIYKTFYWEGSLRIGQVNNVSSSSSSDFGTNLEKIVYSEKGQCVYALFSAGNWSDGAHVGIVKVKEDGTATVATGVSNTASGKYKNYDYYQWDEVHECIWGAVYGGDSSSGYSTKTIDKITPSANITRAYTSSSGLSNISNWWGFKDNLDTGSVLIVYEGGSLMYRDLYTGTSFTLAYGTPNFGSSYYGIWGDYIVTSRKATSDDKFKFVKINKLTSEITVIPNLPERSNAHTGGYYLYDGEPCIFYNNKTYNLNGEIIATNVSAALLTDSRYLDGMTPDGEKMWLDLKNSTRDYYTLEKSYFEYYKLAVAETLPSTKNVGIVLDINSEQSYSSNNTTNIYKIYNLSETPITTTEYDTAITTADEILGDTTE